MGNHTKENKNKKIQDNKVQKEEKNLRPERWRVC